MPRMGLSDGSNPGGDECPFPGSARWGAWPLRGGWLVAHRRAAEERRAWKVAPLAASSKAVRAPSLAKAKMLGGAARASSLLAFQDRAPQGTLRAAEGKRLGHQPPTPQRPRSTHSSQGTNKNQTNP